MDPCVYEVAVDNNLTNQHPPLHNYTCPFSTCTTGSLSNGEIQLEKHTVTTSPEHNLDCKPETNIADITVGSNGKEIFPCISEDVKFICPLKKIWNNHSQKKLPEGIQLELNMEKGYEAICTECLDIFEQH